MEIFAEVIKDEYSDLALGYKYKVKNVMRGYLILDKTIGAGRRYRMNDFKLTDENNRPISYEEARFWKAKYGYTKES